MMQKTVRFNNPKEEKLLASLSPSLNVAIMAVRKAGRAILRDFGEIQSLQSSTAGAFDFAIKTREKSLQTLFRYLQEVRPRYSFMLPDKEKIEGEDISNCFIINPLDGLINFAHGVPFFTISVALIRDNVPYTGVVFNPITDELFYAEKGSGAFLMTAQGDKRLRVSERRNIADAMIALSSSEKTVESFDDCQNKIRFFQERTAGVRTLGSTSLTLAYASAGRFDSVWCRYVSSFETAAGIVLVKEAGGYVRSEKGLEKPTEVLESDTLVATNDTLDTEITKILRK